MRLPQRTCILLSALIFTYVLGYTQTKSQIGQLASLDIKPIAEIMVVGIPHFDETVLNQEAQVDLELLMLQLSKYQASKIVLEQKAEDRDRINKLYKDYLEGKLDIGDRHNEVFQLGFKLAKKLRHKQLYVFDNKTEFIGNLKDFSFDSLMSLAKRFDSGFYDKNLDQIKKVFALNDSIIKNQSLHDRILIYNSPSYQNYNVERMHALEVRVGIGTNWMGVDWLARWYQRNLRMTANLLKMAEKGDRLLVIVGDNHKWVLEEYIDKIPELNVSSAYEFINHK